MRITVNTGYCLNHLRYFWRINIVKWSLIGDQSTEFRQISSLSWSSSLFREESGRNQLRYGFRQKCHFDSKSMSFPVSCNMMSITSKGRKGCLEEVSRSGGERRRNKSKVGKKIITVSIVFLAGLFVLSWDLKEILWVYFLLSSFCFPFVFSLSLSLLWWRQRQEK